MDFSKDPSALASERAGSVAQCDLRSLHTGLGGKLLTIRHPRSTNRCLESQRTSALATLFAPLSRRELEPVEGVEPPTPSLSSWCSPLSCTGSSTLESLEPPAGLEPTTPRLQGGCSASELKGLFNSLRCSSSAPRLDWCGRRDLNPLQADLPQIQLQLDLNFERGLPPVLFPY